MKYMTIINSGDIIYESNNKREAIRYATKQSKRASVINNRGDILYENAEQRRVNNA